MNSKATYMKRLMTGLHREQPQHCSSKGCTMLPMYAAGSAMSTVAAAETPNLPLLAGLRSPCVRKTGNVNGTQKPGSGERAEKLEQASLHFPPPPEVSITDAGSPYNCVNVLLG